MNEEKKDSELITCDRCGKQVHSEFWDIHQEECLPTTELSEEEKNDNLLKSGMANVMNAKFNAVSWILCTTLPLVIMGIATPNPNPERDINFEYVVGFVVGFGLAIAYLSIPYSVYHAQVNKGKKPGCFSVLIFLVITGIVGGIILALIWDLLRFIQFLIMRPPIQIKYAINSPGLLKR